MSRATLIESILGEEIDAVDVVNIDGVLNAIPDALPNDQAYCIALLLEHPDPVIQYDRDEIEAALGDVFNPVLENPVDKIFCHLSLKNRSDNPAEYGRVFSKLTGD